MLVVAAGCEPVKDEARAARQLDRALQRLPVSLIGKVTELLTQREAPAETRSANGSGPSETAHDVADG